MAVFDREGYDAGFFFRLVSDGQPFVSWEMNVDAKRLAAIEAQRFATAFTFKHLQDRHPAHYQPGFKLIDSERQDIANPDLKPSTMENYRSFKQVDNEGKYLFDFVTAGVWNARKQMVDWLRAFYRQDNAVVDLFYAITHCHGWVRNNVDAVTVRSEPLQQSKRRAAQEQLCRRLTAFGVQTPLGKRLVVEVGESPLWQ